jgi:hypothetical protein
MDMITEEISVSGSCERDMLRADQVDLYKQLGYGWVIGTYRLLFAEQ